MKTLSLKLSERLVIASFLPEKESMFVQRIANAILEKVEFDKEEEDLMGPVFLQNPAGVLMVRPDTDYERDYLFEDVEFNLLKENVSKADEKKQITQRIFSLAEKIIKESDRAMHVEGDLKTDNPSPKSNLRIEEEQPD